MASSTVGMRWAKADENFRQQIDKLMGVMRCRSIAKLAEEAGLVPSTLYSHYEHPRKLKKREERQLISVFERYGVPYDVSWGEGNAE